MEHVLIAWGTGSPSEAVHGLSESCAVDAAALKGMQLVVSVQTWVLVGTVVLMRHLLSVPLQAAGKFKDEIVPVHTVVKDKSGNETPVVVSADDGIREGASVESLGRLPTVFKKNGTTTAGNSSQVGVKSRSGVWCAAVLARAVGGLQ